MTAQCIFNQLRTFCDLLFLTTSKTPFKLIHELIPLHNHELMLRKAAIMRSQLKNDLSHGPPGTNSQCSTNELSNPLFRKC